MPNEATVPTIPTQHELTGIIGLVDAAMRQGSDQTMLTDYPLVYLEQNLKNIRIVIADGQVVSVVPYIPRQMVVEGCQLSIGIISPTATHPNYRKRGYALACLKSNVAQMEQDGIDLSILWTQVPTFTFYEHAHYQGVRMQITMYPCQKADAPLFHHHGHDMVTYTPLTEHYLSEIQEMHEREPYGVWRKPEEYRYLFSLPKMQTLIALQDGQPCAYLVTSLATNKPGLVEGGGDVHGLETLVAHALEHWPGEPEAIRGYGYLVPSTLGDLLEHTIGERRQPGPGNMMIRLNNPRRFLEKIKPWLEKRYSGAEGAISFEIREPNVAGAASDIISWEFKAGRLRFGQEQQEFHTVLSRRDFTSVLFGEHLARRVTLPKFGQANHLRDIFPFYFPLWILDTS
ncbi:MAG: GNAT family N-acetyltransferase [Chloroflexi bacterium]|nr:GNAT family N-acetyltransferase [Chloroflexota bacterium]